VSNKNKSEFLKISFVKGSKAAEIAPGFLNSYIDYTEFEQSGQNYINGTKISGETVLVNDGKTAMTAWLVDTDKGVLAVVISYNMSDKTAESSQLNKLLATLTLKES